MLILRDLFKLGPLRFQHFVDVLPGLAPTTLSARLKGLEENGILERQLYSDHPPRAEYALSQKGRKLGPVQGDGKLGPGIRRRRRLARIPVRYGCSRAPHAELVEVCGAGSLTLRQAQDEAAFYC